MAPETFSPQEVRQLLELALRNPDPELAGFALSAALVVSHSPAALLGDAVEAIAGEDVSAFFNLMRRYGRLDLVLELLYDHRAGVRQTTVAALRWIQDPSVLVALERATADEDPGVRAAALSAFGSARLAGATVAKPLALDTVRPPDPVLIALLLDHEPRSEDLDAMIAALNSPPLSVKLRRALAYKAVRIFRESGGRLFEALQKNPSRPSIELMGALGKLGDPRSVPYLLANAGAFANEPLSAICRALADIGGDEAARGLVSLLTRSGAYAAPTALKRIAVAATPPLLEAYARNPLLRQGYAELVSAVAGPAALGPLISAMYDTDRMVRENAEKGLYALGEIAVDPLLQLLASGYFMPRPHAIRVLALLGDRRALRPILDIAADSKDSEHQVAVEALGCFPGTEAIRFLELLLHSDEARLRNVAASALAQSVHTEAAAVLFHAATDENPAVRIAAVMALGQMALRQRSFPAIRALAGAVSNTDLAVAEAAEIALGALPWVAAIPLLEGYIRDHPGENSLRLSAALEKIRGHEITLHAPERDPSVPPVMHLDEVSFSAIAPISVAQGQSFLVDFWAHLEELGDEVAIRSRAARADPEIRLVSRGPVKLARDTAVRVRLSIPTFGLADLEDTVMWTGRIGNTSFPVTVPAEAIPSTHLGYFAVFVGPLQISRLLFELSVIPAGAQPTVPVRHRLKEIRVRSAFASYATEDRGEVLARLQGMLKVVPDLDVFLDVLALRSGEKWEQRIYEEISVRDTFYLFWSLAASRSPWVEKEWRTALTVRGLDYIDPVPLQPASIALPPAELAALHFNDWTLAFSDRV